MLLQLILVLVLFVPLKKQIPPPTWVWQASGSGGHDSPSKCYYQVRWAVALLILFEENKQIPLAPWVLRALDLGAMAAHKSLTKHSLSERNRVHRFLGYVAFCFVVFLSCPVLEKVGLAQPKC